MLRITVTFCALVCVVFGFPVQDLNKRQSRQLIGQWIMNTEWLPIEINVPDTINSISTGISMGFQNLAQQFPFINRVISQERPRPLHQYIVLVPVKVNTQRIPQPNPQPINEFYGPFDNFANKFPAYP